MGACNGATIANDIDGEVVSMFFQKQLVMQIAPFIAIFFSCLFWTCVAIRDCLDPPSERLKRQRRLRHYRKKKKEAFKRHKKFHKSRSKQKMQIFAEEKKKWKEKIKEAKKKNIPESEWPKQPEKKDYIHKKTKFKYGSLKAMSSKRNMNKTKIASKAKSNSPLKPSSEKGSAKSGDEVNSNSIAATEPMKDSLAHGNAFDDYVETDNSELLNRTKLFQGTKANEPTVSIKEKIHERMRVSAEMSKDALGKFDKFIATNVTLMYLCYPVLIKSTFQLVACMPIGKNMYLQMDLNVPCYVGQHLFFTLNLFLPAFICYVVGLPLTGYTIMRRNREKLYERRMKFRYGTLYTGYTEQCYYWECVISIRKCCVLATSVFLTTAGAESQALCGMMICMVGLIFHLHWKPFIRVAEGRHTLFWAEFWALFVAFLTFWTGLFFFQDVASSGPLQMFFTVELISVNSFFCLMTFRWFLILKLMDTQDLIMTRELQGAQEEELKGQRKTVSWLQQLVPEWRQVSHLWAKKAWKATIKHQIMTRRSLSAFGGINLAAATEAAKSSSKEIAPGNDERSTPGRMKPRRASFSTSAQKK